MRLINRRPGKGAALLLAALPFLLLLAVYVGASAARLAENSGDKLLPSPATIGGTIKQYAIDRDTRTGEILLWADTKASLIRFSAGLILAAALGLVFGVAKGVVPYVRTTLESFIAAIALIPPLAVLPILFIVFGLGEVSKVVLIVVGIAPLLMRDLALRVAEIPREEIIKAQTLGANSWTLTLRVVLPQIFPRLLDSVRLQLCSAWLFLIAAEAIAAENGLGYRVFLMRRYLAMDVILPYVFWITLLAFATDWGLRHATRSLYPWYVAAQKS